MQLTIRRHADTPIYRQIVNQVRDQIRSGVLPSGSRLPPVRKVATEYGLTRLTVHSAYGELQAEGLIESHVGRGTFVTGVAPPSGGNGARTAAPWAGQGILAELLRMGEPDNVLSFAQAFPAPETYPVCELGRALQQALADTGDMGYGPIQGDAGLREQIARLLADRGMAVSPDHMLVTSGAQQAIDLVLRTITDPGDVILVEEPVYPGILDLASLRGQRVVGIPNDGGSLRIDALEAACSSLRPRLLYLVPTYSNPTGRSLLPQSRAAVLRLAGAHGLIVVEDDTYGLLGFDRHTPSALKSDDAGERVVYVTSFSKSLAPALRLGALVAPVSLLPSLAAVKHSSDLVCSTLMQRALASYLQWGHMPAHLARARPLYEERRDTMVAALQRHLPECPRTHPEGGLSLFVDLQDGVVERHFVADALHKGVGVAPGSAFFPRPRAGASIRLSFGAQPPERIEEGVATLGQVLDMHLQRHPTALSLTGRAGPLV